jgi:two-component system response regulator AtoC
MTKLPIELQSIIDAQEDPFVLIDENYTIVAANRAYAETYSFKDRDITVQKCYKVSHRSEVPCYLNGEDCPHPPVFQTQEPHHVLHIHYDEFDRPDHVRIKGSPVRGTDGKIYLGEGIFPIDQPDDLSCREKKLIGSSPVFLSCTEQITRAAETDAPILLSGESGVGKHLASQYIHEKSERRGGQFVVLDCPTMSEIVFESELFGHERGAFAGCVGRRFGMFEQTDGGTLFLGEVGELPLSVQTHLLRALETGHFRRVGGRGVLKADVRVVCSSIRDLRKEVARGNFRSDLYYRIAGISVSIPSLRERRQDIPALATRLMQNMCQKGHGRCRLTEGAIEKLMNHHYPGNVRELKNVLQKATSLSTSGLIEPHQIRFEKPLTPAQEYSISNQTEVLSSGPPRSTRWNRSTLPICWNSTRDIAPGSPPFSVSVSVRCTARSNVTACSRWASSERN